MNANDTRDEQTAAQPMTRRERPYWVTAVAIIAVVAVIVVGGVWLANRFRPQVSVEPAPPLPAAVATTAPRVTQAPAAKVAVAAAVTPTPTLPGGLRIGNSPLEREIEAAYLRYWDVLAQAYFDLDGSHLTEVMAGEELRQTQEQIQQLKSQGRAAKVDVVHQMAFVKVAPESAQLYDQYLNRSVFLDTVTKEELKTSQPPTKEKLLFSMEKRDGQWKVVEGVRHE